MYLILQKPNFRNKKGVIGAYYNSVLDCYYFRISEFQRNHYVLTLKSTNKYNLCNNGIRASKQIKLNGNLIKHPLTLSFI